MKKTITILLSLIMIFCLAACGDSAGQAEGSSAESNSIEGGTANDAESSADDNANIESSADDNANIESSADNNANTESSPDENANTESSADNDTQTQGSDTQTGTESAGQPEAEIPETQETKVLVAYFSATGTTEGMAEHIANGLNADIYEIVPEEPYTDADLNYNDNNSRSTIEMNDPSSRPAIAGSVENMEEYDIVFIGYPIWWGEAPRIVSTFVESYDFSGKTVVPFCTSGGSGVGSSASDLEELTSGATWMEGHRLNGSDSQETVMK